MKAAALAALKSSGSGALAKALSDAGVARVAKTLNLDLEDPATLNKLLELSQQYVDASPQISQSQKQMLTQELFRDERGLEHEAVRTYLEISAMG